MKINKIGLNYNHCDNFNISRPNGSGDYLFLHVKTPAIFHLQNKEITAEKNSVIIYNKNTPQYYAANHGSFANDFIHFDIEGEPELRNLLFDTVIPLPSVKQVNKILKDIYLEYVSNNPAKEESMDLLLKLLFIKVREFISYKPHNSVLYGYYDELLNLRSMIYRHPEEKWTIARLSDKINLSPSHFQRLYKQTFGVTCISDVIAGKISYAKVSLSATGGTVREISTLCGYENEEHFMRQFKQVVGVTPTEYRRLLIK